jgi:excinuclease ABC subunit B
MIFHFVELANRAYLSKPEIEKRIRENRKSMEKAAKNLYFRQAAKLRDDIKALQEQLA